MRARGLLGLSGVLGVAQARKLCQNPFRFDGVFLSGPSGVSGFRLVGIPVTLPRSG
jgi:hypothetical protein